MQSLSLNILRLKIELVALDPYTFQIDTNWWPSPENIYIYTYEANCIYSKNIQHTRHTVYILTSFLLSVVFSPFFASTEAQQGISNWPTSFGSPTRHQALAEIRQVSGFVGND